jgi:hypothetical protein
MIMSHHPTVGEYGRQHTTSFSNPVLMSGNLFVHGESRFVQEVINPLGRTAFFVNSLAYLSVSRGFNVVVQDPALEDAQVVEAAMTAMLQNDFKLLRVHLQSAGNIGRTDCAYSSPDRPYHRNIWGDGSPYVQAVKAADALLGQFVAFLKEQGLWEDTVLIVTSDHGQSNQGWHPVTDPDSWRTPLVMLGPGIAVGRQLAYVEHTDLVPTICQLIGVNLPNPGPGAGRPVESVLAGRPDQSSSHPRFIEHVNRQNVEYLNCRACLQLASVRDSYFSSQISLLENDLITPEPFYSVDQFLQWHRAGSVEHLLEANETILQQIRVDAAAAAKLLGLTSPKVH